MIELIFVIVILGILAAVAIPKMMATRTDAKISAMAQQVQSAIQEIPQYVVSQGEVKGLDEMSQVIAQLKEQGKAVLASANNINNGKATIKTEDGTGSDENCITLEVNSTHLMVKHENGSGAVCKGVQARISEANFTIAGQGVKF
jgi:general secretion pathway protein G